MNQQKRFVAIGLCLLIVIAINTEAATQSTSKPDVATLATWFGVPQQNLPVVFPNIANLYPRVTLPFMG